MKRSRLFIAAPALCLCLALAFSAYHYYAAPTPRAAYTTNKESDTLNIAYIGDSWAFFHDRHNCRLASIVEDSICRPANVYSMGVCGLTSKEIYGSLFENTRFRQFFRQRSYDYCLVSCGINDTYRKMGIGYYKKSLDCIIQFLFSNNIHPILMEIPDYDIEKAYNHQRPDRKLLRHFSMLANGTAIDCKQAFRDALNELVQEKGYEEKVSIVRYRAWNKDFTNDQKHLYLNDGMHLNGAGYEALDSAIAKEILKDFSRHRPL